MRHTHRFAAGLAVSTCLWLLSGCDDVNGGDPMHKVNGSVHALAGVPASSAETVNGSIDIDDNAVVLGVSTVNGGIHVGSGATATGLTTVNGGIVIGAGAHVTKNAETVNGSVSVANGADVAGSITNVNGKIALDSAHVGAGITTVKGDILIYGSSHVEGGIHMEKSTGIIQLETSVPRVEIGPGVTVQGELKFDREVKLYVSDKATIGPVSGATAIPFTGDAAPRD